MSINLNADMGTIIKELFDKKNSKKGNAATVSTKNKMAYYKNTILYCILMVCGFLSASFAMYHKANNSVKNDESEFKTYQELDTAFQKMDADLTIGKTALKNNIEKTKIILPKVTDIGDEKKLFKLISQLAEDNNLKIQMMSKEKTKPEAIKTEADKQQKQKFTELPITIQVSGRFADYMAFKSQLFTEKPILRIDSETVNINKIEGKKSSAINIQIKLTDFIIGKEEFEKIINKYEKSS